MSRWTTPKTIAPIKLPALSVAAISRSLNVHYSSFLVAHSVKKITTVSTPISKAAPYKLVSSVLVFGSFLGGLGVAAGDGVAGGTKGFGCVMTVGGGGLVGPTPEPPVGEVVGLREGKGEPDGEVDGAGEGDEDGEVEGEGVAVGLPVGVGEIVGVGVPVGTGVGDTLGVGMGSGVGCGLHASLHGGGGVGVGSGCRQCGLFLCSPTPQIGSPKCCGLGLGQFVGLLVLHPRTSGFLIALSFGPLGSACAVEARARTRAMPAKRARVYFNLDPSLSSEIVACPLPLLQSTPHLGGNPAACQWFPHAIRPVAELSGVGSPSSSLKLPQAHLAMPTNSSGI